MDSEKEEGAGTDSGISSVGEAVKEQISEGGKGFNVPEIEFQEYKVTTIRVSATRKLCCCFVTNCLQLGLCVVFVY